MESTKKRYRYMGPVESFGRCINPRWYGETISVSKAKAKSNLTFRYKQEHGLVPGAKIELPGEIILINAVH